MGSSGGSEEGGVVLRDGEDLFMFKGFLENGELVSPGLEVRVERVAGIVVGWK